MKDGGAGSDADELCGGVDQDGLYANDNDGQDKLRGEEPGNTTLDDYIQADGGDDALYDGGCTFNSGSL